MGQTLPTMDNLAAGDGELFVQELRVLGDQGAGAGDLLFGGQGDDNAAAGELLLVQGQGDENAAADNRLLDGQGDAPPATEVTHVPLFEHRSFADNYVVASCILSHLADVEVRGLRSVCKTWAAAGGVILSRRNGGNKRAYLTFERERDAKRKIGRLNKLLARTTTPRYLLPANYAAMGISTTCMRSKTDVRATPTFQLFLERYGKYVKSVEFHRTSARPDDNLMFDDLKTILQTCENLTDFAFLPYKATFTFVNRGPHHQQQQLREQMVTTFRQNLVWTPIRAAISLSVAMGPLKITTLILHICHPRHLAVLITLCPNLKDLAFLAPNVETRTSAQVLADWEGFQDAVNEIGGINTIESLTLQEWDLVPNVEMKNLQTIKLSMRRGISTLPVSQKISYLTIYPQVRNVDLYLYQPRPSLAENGAIHRFINRFPGMTTLLVDIKPSPGVVADWTPFQQQEHLHAIANGHLFNPVECAINYNVKNLFILNLQLFEFHVHPPVVPEWKPLSNFTKMCPNVENLAISFKGAPRYFAGQVTLPYKLDEIFKVAQEWRKLKAVAVSKPAFRCPEILLAFSRIGLMNNIHDLTLHQSAAKSTYNRYGLHGDEKRIDQTLLPAVITTGSRLQSFKMSGFEEITETVQQPHHQHQQATPNFLEREAPFLGNVSLEKFEFNQPFQTGITLSKDLQIKLI